MRPTIPNRSRHADSSLPEPPVWFKEDRLELYYSLGDKIVQMKYWYDSNYDALVILVDNLVVYYEAAQIVADEGSLIKGREGNMVRHPSTIAKNAAWSNIQPLMTQFGLTPASRSAMGVGDSVVSKLNKYLPGQEVK